LLSCCFPPIIILVWRPAGGADLLIGRDGELSRLVRWVRDVAAGRGRAVLVEGEPGIGLDHSR
jgi:transcriptional regulator with AAA-type ATPase domain